MPRWKALFGGVANVGILLCLASSASAEVAVEVRGHSVNMFFLGSITDDPNPIGFWTRFRPVAVDQVLNDAGDLRGDGPPRVAWKPDGRPVVVWAYKAGGDHDIALSEWDGGAWGQIEFLTSSTHDDLDPRVFIEADGTLHVVWWSAVTVGEVFLSSTAETSPAPAPPVPVTDGSHEGRRPSVAVHDGVVWIAYERDSVEAGMAQAVVVARRENSGEFSPEFVAHTEREEPLDVMLHVAGDRLWVDWKHAADELGYAAYEDAGWSQGARAPWTDPSWVGVEGARKLVHRRVMRSFEADEAQEPAQP